VTSLLSFSSGSGMVAKETVIGLESQRQFVGDICQQEQVGDEYSLVTDQNTSVSRPHVTCTLHRPEIQERCLNACLCSL
jgi:hypothetical protein